MERPDFIPWTWSRGKWNRRLWDRPDKVMRWFVYGLLTMAVITPLAWSTEDRGIHYLTLAAAIVVALQALVYGPRAWRANRTRRRNARPHSS